MAAMNMSESEIELPLVDLDLLNSEQGRSKLTKIIREACEDWGFFNVINHGVDSDLIQAIDSVSRDLFTLPAEIKEKAVFSTYFDGYTGRSAALPYRESMSFSRVLFSDSVDRISDTLWTQRNPDFCKAVKEYSYKVEELAKTLVKLTVSSLGLDVALEKSLEGNLRMNYYTPPFAQTSTLPLKGHKDFSCLTVLYQDHMGGLEVLTKEGMWAAVKPLKGSFAVNVGDSLEIWSNCRYRSAVHRVKYGGWTSRLSLAFFMHFADDEQVYAPEELIDDDHPRRHKAFCFKEYKEYKQRVFKNDGIPNPFRISLD
ncbi:hypothetical protein SUGI_0181580 [Cryptomeria japonica]|uniref:gibberellin 20 oxidase 1-D n=1 Tax=Cryptomeria japonica TaxID=3369 RepID=UPI002408A706|nr:gibberellin 20 oxidase 1-D [Cryptomeria japonica]GLJ11991.1 hypothetical protein SUGI_0181580 [Cryptomeria japonica]